MLTCRLITALRLKPRRRRRRRFKERRGIQMDGRNGRRGGGHRSLSRITRPSGGALPFSVCTPPPPPCTPTLPSSSLILVSFLCRDRRRGISCRIKYGSSFHRRTEGDGGKQTLAEEGAAAKLSPQNFILHTNRKRTLTLHNFRSDLKRNNNRKRLKITGRRLK